MRQRNFLKFILIITVAAGVYLFARAESPRHNKPTCPESMEECCKKGESGNKMIWESLSHQFFSSI